MGLGLSDSRTPVATARRLSPRLLLGGAGALAIGFAVLAAVVLLAYFLFLRPRPTSPASDPPSVA